MGVAAPNVLSPELAEKIAVQGSVPLENPGGQIHLLRCNTMARCSPALGSNVEATKTEPDKNTYLVLPHLSGPDHAYATGAGFCSRAMRAART